MNNQIYMQNRIVLKRRKTSSQTNRDWIRGGESAAYVTPAYRERLVTHSHLVRTANKADNQLLLASGEEEGKIFLDKCGTCFFARHQSPKTMRLRVIVASVGRKCELPATGRTWSLIEIKTYLKTNHVHFGRPETVVWTSQEPHANMERERERGEGEREREGARERQREREREREVGGWG